MRWSHENMLINLLYAASVSYLHCQTYQTKNIGQARGSRSTLHQTRNDSGCLKSLLVSTHEIEQTAPKQNVRRYQLCGIWWMYTHPSCRKACHDLRGRLSPRRCTAQCRTSPRWSNFPPHGSTSIDSQRIWVSFWGLHVHNSKQRREMYTLEKTVILGKLVRRGTRIENVRA